METTQMTPSFSSTFFDLTVFNILVCNILVSNILNLKILKIHFDVVVHLWFILVCKIPQFLVKGYRFRQLITLFQKGDTLRLLKIHIMFCPPAGAKYPFFLRSSSWTTALTKKKNDYGHLVWYIMWYIKSTLYKRFLTWNKMFKKLNQLQAKLRSL